MRLPLFQGQQQPIHLGLTTRQHGWRSFFPQRELANTVQKYQIENDMAPPLLNRKRPKKEVPAQNCRFVHKATSLGSPVRQLKLAVPGNRPANDSTSAFSMPVMANLPACKHSFRPANLLDCLLSSSEIDDSLCA